MSKLEVFKIAFGDTRIYVPKKANVNYFNEGNVIEKIKETLLKGSFAKSIGTLEVTEEEIDKPRDDFSLRIFKCPTLEVLCYEGFGYPRYFKEGKIFYSCWLVYEFGDWGSNENHYYNEAGKFENIERY